MTSEILNLQYTNDPVSNWRATLHEASVATGVGDYMQVGGLSAVTFQVSGITSATVTFQASVGDDVWQAVQVANANNGVISTTATADGLYVMPVAGYALVRANITAWVSGTVKVVAIGTVTGTPSLADVSITGASAVTVADGADVVEGAVGDAAVITNASGTISAKLRGLVAILADVWTDAQNALGIHGNIASGAADSGNPVKVGGKYNASAPTLTDGNRGDMQLDVNANAKTREQYAPVYEDNTAGKAVVEHRYTYSRVTSDAQVKSSAGFIHTVTVTPTTATPTAGLVTIYDNTAESGTAIFSEWVFATDVAHTVILDVTTTTGIYVGYDGTLANVSVTVSYR